MYYTKSKLKSRLLQYDIFPDIGLYYLISCRAIEVFPPRATLFTPPPPRHSTSISTREKIMTCDST